VRPGAHLARNQGPDYGVAQSPSHHSGHEYRRSLEVYSPLSLADAQQRYDEVIDRFPGGAAMW
jgi:hypothetical protein